MWSASVSEFRGSEIVSRGACAHRRDKQASRGLRIRAGLDNETSTSHSPAGAELQVDPEGRSASLPHCDVLRFERVAQRASSAAHGAIR